MFKGIPAKQESTFSEYSKVNFFQRIRVSLLLFDSGKTLRSLKKIRNFLDSKTEFLKKLINSVITLKNNSIIHQDVKPGNLCFQPPTRVNPFQKRNRYSKMTPKNVRNISHVPRFQNSKRLTPVKKGALESIKQINISKNVSKNQPKIESNKSKYKRQFEDVLNLNNRYFSRTKSLRNPENTGKLKIIDFGLSKFGKYQVFKEIIRKSVDRLKQYASKTDLKLEKLDPSFCFYFEIKILISQTQISKSIFSSVTSGHSLGIEMSHDVSEFSNYVGQINKHFVKDQMPTILEIETEPRVTLLDNLKYFIDDFEYRRNLRTMSLDLTPSFEKEWLRLKRLPIRGTLKYASILSFLKIKPNFLFDCESLFYTMLEFLDSGPEQFGNSDRLKPTCKVANDSLFESQKHIKMPTKDILQKRSLISESELDTLISVLCLTQKSQFAALESALEKILGLQSRKRRLKRMINTRARERDQHIFLNEMYLSYSEVNRFRILKHFLEELMIIQAQAPGQLLNLKPKIAIQFRHKINIFGRMEFRFLPFMVQQYFIKFKKMLFNFLISFMFSAEIHFLHKFLVIFCLKAFIV